MENKEAVIWYYIWTGIHSTLQDKVNCVSSTVFFKVRDEVRLEVRDTISSLQRFRFIENIKLAL